MADGRLQDNPSAQTLIWWSNGSINSTLILACEDVELNPGWTARTCAVKPGPCQTPMGQLEKNEKPPRWSSQC